MKGGVTSQPRPNTWTRVTAVQTGSYSAAVGDYVRYDSSSLTPTVLLPPISSENKGGRLCITSDNAQNANGVNTIPAGTDTVLGFPAGAGPGFFGPDFAVVFVSDGISNWAAEAFS